MAVKVVCPNPECDASYSVAPENLGKQARCKRCGARFILGDVVGGWVAGSKQAGAAAGASRSRNSDSVEKSFASLPNSLGRYRILRRLGRGGMGSVFLAHDTQLDRPVALKIPDLGGDDSGELVERFHREARAAAKLHHANLCAIYDVGQAGSVHFLTMAYLEGQTLAEVIKERGRAFGEVEAATMIRTLALAMAEAHRRGVVHRDLKPANIMITEAGVPVIMDFGLARRFEDERMTFTGAVLGTPAYMPPEQAAGEDTAGGPAGDVYALGVILYEMIAGRPPYQGSPTHVLTLVIKEAPPPPSEFRPELDPGLVAVVSTAMARDLADRYPSMEAFAAALGSFLDRRLLGETRTIEALAPVGLDPGPGPARRPWMAVGLGALILAALWLVAWFVTDVGTARLQIGDPASVVKIEIDDRSVPPDQYDAPITLRVGPHELEVLRRDGSVQTLPFTITRGREEAVTIPEPTAPAPSPSAAVQRSEPDEPTDPEPQASAASATAIPEAPPPADEVALVNGVEVHVGDPQLTLTWDTKADLDLHVLEPGGSHLSWQNPSGRQGGRLDVDDTDGDGPENAFWGGPGKGQGPPGEYKWYVQYHGAASGYAPPTRWTVRVRHDGLSEDIDGELRSLGQKSQVHSFHLGTAPADGGFD